MMKMRMMVAGFLLAAPVPAMAQLAVVDSSNLAQAISTARNTLKQIEEAQKLYESVNQVTDIASAAQVLNSDLMQRGLPSGVRDSVQLASTNLSELGSIGDRARQMLDARNLSGAINGADGALGSAAQLAARDAAMAEASLSAGDQTAEGISQLKARLATSASAKETADLQAEGRAWRVR